MIAQYKGFGLNSDGQLLTAADVQFQAPNGPLKAQVVLSASDAIFGSSLSFLTITVVIPHQRISVENFFVAPESGTQTDEFVFVG
jgi:hypothetical protein